MPVTFILRSETLIRCGSAILPASEYAFRPLLCWSGSIWDLTFSHAPASRGAALHLVWDRRFECNVTRERHEGEIATKGTYGTKCLCAFCAFCAFCGYFHVFLVSVVPVLESPDT